MDLASHLNRPNSNPFRELIGFTFTHCEDGKCSAELEIREDHLHGGRVVHGGIAFALVDSTMATGIISTLESGQMTATIELKMSYLAPVREGLLQCDSWIVKKGRTIAFTESKVHVGDKLIATATGSFAIIDPK